MSSNKNKRDNSGLTKVIKLADDNLYVAKNSGKGKIESNN